MLENNAIIDRKDGDGDWRKKLIFFSINIPRASCRKLKSFRQCHGFWHLIHNSNIKLASAIVFPSDTVPIIICYYNARQ
jgi:hypothetical protein